MFKKLKLSQKIFFIVILMLFLVANSWAFTFTTVLDFRDSFSEVREYSLPSVVVTSELKDHIYLALLSVYDYIATGDPDSKTTYQDEFSTAIRKEYELFQLSQSSAELEFTQQFNEQLLAIYNAADELITLYEANSQDPRVAEKLGELKTLGDAFNIFLENEVTNQITNQVDQANTTIAKTVRMVQFYLVGVGILVICIVVFSIFFINRNITKPVRLLTEATQSFGKGLFHKVKLRRNDELGLFAKTFNTMAENIQASQTALQEELTKTKELDRQKSEFLSIAAHQLRTPMAGIRWVSQMFYDGDIGAINKEQKHHMGNALENIDRMINLINDLLDVTKIEEQKFQYKFVEQDIIPVVQEQIKELSATAQEKTITVALTAKPERDLLAEIDKEKFGLAISNLLDNAIKYSKKNGTVEIYLERKVTVVFGYVRDEGLGIPKKSQAEVFTKFFRGPNILKVVTEGTGLGLFIVKDILAKHEGKIWFESEENKGTTFYFEIPLHQPKSTAKKVLKPLVVEAKTTAS